jgi:hypothetical protein
MKPQTQAERILAFLEARGELGVLNTELNEIAYRYSARLSDLRRDGYRIRSAHIKNATWRFALLPQDTENPQTLQIAAELDDPQYMEFLELLRPSNCCGEIIVDGMCGGCHEHV